MEGWIEMCSLIEKETLDRIEALKDGAHWKKKSKQCRAKDQIVAHYIKKYQRGQLTHDE